MKYDYDVAVIWSGSGGLTVSIWLAAAGKKVALIEKWLIGGDCTNFGCVPSKALIDIAASWKFKDMKDALEKARARRKKIQDEETPEKIENYGMKVVQGFASFKDEHTLLIDNKQEISANKIIISTGSHPRSCSDLDNVDTTKKLTNESIFEQEENIKKLVVVGWGYIGCELAESFQNLWIDVTLIQRNKYLIPKEEKESSETLKEIFESKWMRVLTNTSIEKSGSKTITIKNKESWKTEEIEFDKVLIALGRSANIAWLWLENAGIKNCERWIHVDSYNRTNKKHIFAIGDCVAGNPQFTHWANNEWRGVVRNIILPFPKSSVRNAILPAVLYTNIEVARVGKTTEELQKKLWVGGFVTKQMSFSVNDRSKVTEDEQGFIMIHFARLSGKILWATIMWKWAWEMLSILSSAMQNKTSAYKLAKVIYPYPTKAELIKRICDSYVVHTLTNIKSELFYFLKSYKIQIIIALLWWAILTTFITYKNATWLTVEQLFFHLYNFIISNAWLGPIIFITAYVIRPLLLLPWALATIMAGALFGFWYWLLYLLIWAVLSADFFYVLWRVFGKKMIQDDGGWIMNNLKNKCDESPFMTILMTRLLFFPYDLVNIASGVLKIDFKSFNLATLIGIIPWSAVFVYAGTAFYGQKLNSFSDLASGIDVSKLLYAGIAFLFISFWAKYLKKKTS